MSQLSAALSSWDSLVGTAYIIDLMCIGIGFDAQCLQVFCAPCGPMLRGHFAEGNGVGQCFQSGPVCHRADPGLLGCQGQLHR